MKIAVCISGGIRTFAFPCVYKSIYNHVIKRLRTLGHVVDTFIVFNLADVPRAQSCRTAFYSNQALDHFSNALGLIEPVDIQLLDIQLNPPLVGGNAQLFQIDRSFSNAMAYVNNDPTGQYDYFFRLRPDFAFFKDLPDVDRLDPGCIETCIKSDAPASDQMFAISDDMYRSWWLTTVVNMIMAEKIVAPEYFIFKEKCVNQRYDFAGALVRGFQVLGIWGGDTERPSNFWAAPESEYQKIVARELSEQDALEALGDVIGQYVSARQIRPVI